MKYTVLLDSSNTSLSVGIADSHEIIDSTSYEAWQAQSEHMIPELDKLLKKHSVERNDILDVMVAIGPGSYTGVRIALTIAKTIATALEVKLIPVSSLQVLKDGAQPSICLINARSGRSFVGVYQNEICLLPDCIMKNDDVISYINAHPSYSVCGNSSYLNIIGKQSNIVQEMWSLKPFLKPADNALGVVPVYMKD